LGISCFYVFYGQIMTEKNNLPQAVLFAGQGSQTKGMGRALAEKFPEAMCLWKKAEKASGLGLRGIYWEGSEEEMADTAALQPALTAVNLSIWNVAGLHPCGAAGHSLGEFSALGASGALSVNDVLRITALRGKLMAQANGGAMAAIVKLAAGEVSALVDEAASETGKIAVCANFNTPLQTVVSGEKEAIDLMCKKAREKKGRAIMLPVSGAFHSPMMAEANREFLPALKKADWHDPRFPIYCNVTGKAARSGAELLENIGKQMVSPVLWVETIRSMWADGARKYMEIGPKAVLGKMVTQDLDESAHPEVELVSVFAEE